MNVRPYTPSQFGPSSDPYSPGSPNAYSVVTDQGRQITINDNEANSLMFLELTGAPRPNTLPTHVELHDSRGNPIGLIPWDDPRNTEKSPEGMILLNNDGSLNVDSPYGHKGLYLHATQGSVSQLREPSGASTDSNSIPFRQLHLNGFKVTPASTTPNGPVTNWTVTRDNTPGSQPGAPTSSFSMTSPAPPAGSVPSANPMHASHPGSYPDSSRPNASARLQWLRAFLMALLQFLEQPRSQK